MGTTQVSTATKLVGGTWNLPFDEWKFLWPPRPETVINPVTVGFYEDKGWIAQHKLNGTCSLIGVSPDGELHNLTRHGEKHKRWVPVRSRVIVDFAPKGVWTVFLAELLHEKTTTVKDTLYIFDLLVQSSQQLVGTTQEYRQTLLSAMFLDPLNEVESHFVIHPNIWLAKPVVSGFADVFASIKARKDKLVEGLVLKNPQGVLEPMFKTGNNQSWQVKARIPVPNSHRGM